MSMETIKTEYQSELALVEDAKQLSAFWTKYLGKGGQVQKLMEGIKNVPNEEKKAYGQAVNQIKNWAQGLYDEKKEEIDKKVKEVAAKIKITDEQLKKNVSELSGGQQQRAAIARALAAKPAIILADEPTGNLDSVTSHDVLGLLKMAAKQFSQTLILITHDRDIAQLADRIVHIEDGKIVGDTRKGSDSYA